MTFGIDAWRETNGLVDHPFNLTYLQHNTVQLNDRINRIQWSILPFNNLFHHTIRDLRNETSRYIERRNDISGAHAFGIQAENLIVLTGDALLPFLN